MQPRSPSPPTDRRDGDDALGTTEPAGDGGPRAGMTRRGLLATGGGALGTVVAGLWAAAALAPSSQTPVTPGTAAASPAASPAATATPTAPPLPALPALASPTPFATFTKLMDSGVMQDFAYLPGDRTFFVTQKTNGSNGSALPYETLIVNRVGPSGVALDAMTLIDGGHGLGIEAQAAPDGTAIWITWLGKTADSDWRESDFVRLRYTPGTWTRGQAVQMLGLTVVAIADGIEAQYRFDRANGWAVERHFDYNGATETYKRRRLADLEQGLLLPDDEIDLLPLPVNPPTTQGFATDGDTFYRWVGASTSDNVIVANDPIRLERWDWPTRQLRAAQDFPNLSRTGGGWPGGKLEPEGAALFREADGSATLLVGDTTGLPRHQHHVSAFAGVGA